MPPGQRVYAIGDIHGRLDLFHDLMLQIEADDAARPLAELTVILLGDLVDRGPDSASVIDHVLRLREAGVPIRALLGNHERMMLSALDNEPNGVAQFLKIGGRATFRSYGVTDAEMDELDTPALAAAAAALVGPRHLAFLRSLETSIQIGDYLFVHAGIRPGRSIDEQMESDLLWIRNPFLDSDVDHGCMVVHGHTPTPTIDLRPNRIGVDTGAYFSGQLTALGIEEADLWTLTAEGEATGRR